MFLDLGAEVESLFQIWLARRQLAANREVASPGFAAKRHPNLHLLLEILPEERPADLFKTLLEMFIDGMVDDVEKSKLTASCRDRRRSL